MTRLAITIMGITATTATITMDATSTPAIAVAAVLPAAYMRFSYHTFQAIGGSGPQDCSDATWLATTTMTTAMDTTSVPVFASAAVGAIWHATTTTGIFTAAVTTAMDVPAITISAAVLIINICSCITVYKLKSRLGLPQIALLLLPIT